MPANFEFQADPQPCYSSKSALICLWKKKKLKGKGREDVSVHLFFFGSFRCKIKSIVVSCESINLPYIMWKFLQDALRVNVIDLGFIFFRFYSTIGLECALDSIRILKPILNWLEFFPNDWWLVKDMQFKRTLQHFDCLMRSRICSSFRAPLNFFLLRIVQTFWNVSLLKLIVVTLTIIYRFSHS